jgi:hypothetical protein
MFWSFRKRNNSYSSQKCDFIDLYRNRPLTVDGILVLNVVNMTS